METIEEKLAKADRLTAITQRIGFALWQLQELEGVSAQYFVLLAQAEQGMGMAAGNALVEKASRNAFGKTIRRMEKAGLLSSELENRFFKLLSERNWLVHRSRGDSRGAVHNDQLMQQLLVRIDWISEESLSILREVGSLTEAHVKQHGVTERYIKEKAKELLSEWHAEDAI